MPAANSDKKEFRFLTSLLDTQALEVRCPGGHQHVKIEGKYTRPSAVYTWDLAKHVAFQFARALRRWRSCDDTVDVGGYESVAVNDQ